MVQYGYVYKLYRKLEVCSFEFFCGDMFVVPLLLVPRHFERRFLSGAEGIGEISRKREVIYLRFLHVLFASFVLFLRSLCDYKPMLPSKTNSAGPFKKIFSKPLSVSSKVTSSFPPSTFNFTVLPLRIPAL